MKILYGVQATGNGHISRARAMNRQFEHLGISVDYVFSGRDPSQYFDMDEFRHKRYFQGLTLLHTQGEVNIARTLKENSLRHWLREIKQLDTCGYDLVMTDFEPITAWACRKQHNFCLGLGHQYAFNEAIPKAGETFISRLLMNHFAPCDQTLGMHWHHFNCPVLPPIAETHIAATGRDQNQYLVYLAFEDKEDIVELLEGFDAQTFICYGPYKQFEIINNIQFKPPSRQGFKEDLAQSAGVICNAGFELPSEAMQLGIKLLVKPLRGQFEQESNARAIHELGIGLTMTRLDKHKLAYWLNHFQARQIVYPNVAKAVAEWIATGNWQDKTELAQRLWSQVKHLNMPGLANSGAYSVSGAKLSA